MATNKSERNELRRMGAKPHKNSGRGMIKGDGNTSEFIVDVKEANKTFTLSQEVWAKICTDAMKADRNKSPMLQIVLGEGRNIVRLSVVEWTVLQDLIERANNDNA